MTHESNQQLRLRAADVNAAVTSLHQALLREIEVIDARIQDAIGVETPDGLQRLNEQRDRLSRELDNKWARRELHKMNV